MSSHNDLREQIGKLFEQAFTDGASDTMWQNDRHVEIYKTAVDKAMQAITTTIKAEVAAARIESLQSIFGMRPIIGMDRYPSRDLSDLINNIKNSIGELQATQQQDSNKKEGLK